MEILKLSDKEILKKDRLLLLDIIFNEHSYTKPFEAHPDFNRIHSAKVLNFQRQVVKSKPNLDDSVDVTTVEDQGPLLVSYDEGKAKAAMSELEKCIALMAESTDEDEKILRGGWTADQASLFDQVYKALLSYQLARLAYDKKPNEPVLRRLALDKAIRRVRSYFAGIAWDAKLTSWIHGTLIDGLGSSLFLCYVEILQGLKSKVPSFVERLFTMSTQSIGRRELFNSLTLTNTFKKTWTPTNSLPGHTKAENEIGQQTIPYILVIPSGPSISLSTSKRARFWHTQLSSFSRSIPVNMHTSRTVSQIDPKTFLENMISAVRSKVLEFRSNNPERKLVLLGWHVGALVACEVALLDTVSAVVCLGFPSVGLHGKREVSNDPYQEIKAPVMFVLGSHSPISPIDNVEALRERMKTSTQLVVVEGGNATLKLTTSHKKRIGLTQNMVDKLVIDEIQIFLRKAFTPDQSKNFHNPNIPGIIQSARAKADRKRKLKRAMLNKNNFDSKKKKKVMPVVKPDASLQESGTTGDTAKHRNVSIPFQKATLARAIESSYPAINEGTPVVKAGENGREVENLEDEENKMPQNDNDDNTAVGIEDKTEKPRLPSETETPMLVMSALKNGHGRLVNKRTGKPLDKIGKRPKSRKSATKTSLGTTGAFTKVSHAGTITLQNFPPGSVLLSGGGSHVRFHRGTSILYVPSSSGPTPIVRTSSLISSASPKAGQSFVTQTITQPINTVVSASSGTIAGTSRVVFSGGTTAAPTTTSTLSTTTSSQETSSKLPPVGTQLSQTDIQYLANIISKQTQPRSAADKTGLDKHTPGSGANTRTTVSPISTKISIGTISNLNASEKLKKVEEAHGLFSREAKKVVKLPGQNEKLSPEKGDKYPKDSKTSEVDKESVKPQIQIAKTQNNFKVSAMTSSQSQPTKTVPVTLTIPLSSLPGNFAIQPSSFSLKALPKGGNSKFVSKINTSATSSLSALLTQQKFVLSSVPNSAGQSATGKFTAVVSKEGLKTSSLSTSSPLSLHTVNTVIQGSAKGGQVKQQGTTSLANFVKAPATITLHLPSSALLRDPKFGKDGNSQIKFIGLLNAQGRSPISSPIHFSNLKTQSAPVSPSSETSPVAGLVSATSSPASPARVEINTPTSTKENAVSGLQVIASDKGLQTDVSGRIINMSGNDDSETVKPSNDNKTNDFANDTVNHIKNSTTLGETTVSTLNKLSSTLCGDNVTEGEIPTPTKKEE